MMQDETRLLQNKTVDRFKNLAAGSYGSKSPRKNDLCKKYNVSKITVRQAVNNLVSDGLSHKDSGQRNICCEFLAACWSCHEDKAYRRNVRKGGEA